MEENDIKTSILGRYDHYFITPIQQKIYDDKITYKVLQELWGLQFQPF